MSATLRSSSSSEDLSIHADFVGGLVRAGRVAERLERVQDDLLGERLRGVVRAGVLARRGLLDHQAAVEDDEGVAAQVAADQRRATADALAQLEVVADGLGERADRGRLDLGVRGPWRARPPTAALADG